MKQGVQYLKNNSVNREHGNNQAVQNIPIPHSKNEKMAAATTLEVIKKRGDGPHNKIGGHQKTTIWPPQQHWRSSKYENMASTTKSEVIKKCRN